MRFLLLVGLLAVLSSCDGGSGETQYSIGGMSPTQFYMQFASPADTKDECVRTANLNSRPQIRLLLYDDYTFELATADERTLDDQQSKPVFIEKKGTWSVQRTAMYLSVEREIIGVGSQHILEQDGTSKSLLKIRWQTQELTAANRQPIVVLTTQSDYNVCDANQRALQQQQGQQPNDEETEDGEPILIGSEPKNDETAGVVQHTEKVTDENGVTTDLNLEINTNKKTVRYLNRPEELWMQLAVSEKTDAVTKLLDKYRGRKTLVEACDAERERVAELRDNEDAVSELNMLNDDSNIAATIEFSQILSPRQQDINNQVMEGVASKLGPGYSVLPNPVSVDKGKTKYIENTPSFLALASEKIASDNPMLDYREIEDGVKYQVNIGQLCDIAQSKLSFSAWVSVKGQGAHLMEVTKLEVTGLE